MHSTFPTRLVLPKRSVILLWFFLVLLIAALLVYLAFNIIFMRKCIITITCTDLEPRILSATVTWNVTRLSENLARHVFLVPRDSYDDLMVGS